MSLVISDIQFNNFRTYEKLELKIDSNLVVFYGPNACGKTNIVEGLQFLTYGDSFKKPSVQEVITWNNSEAYIQCSLIEEPRNIRHTLSFKDNKKTYSVNGKKKSKSFFCDDCSAVLFIPDDLQMIKAASQTRRNALDILGMSLSKTYSNLKKEYNQTIKQRNLLLKENLSTGSLFESWNDNLVINGARLCANRFKLFKRISKKFKQIIKELAPENIDLLYIPSWLRFDEQGRQKPDVMSCNDIQQVDITNSYAEEKISESIPLLFNAENARKTSLVGPHKDDVIFVINEYNARLFASQGQQRTLVLAWKLAEMLTIQDIKNQKPLLLLDDVMSELDQAHKNDLVQYLSSAAQTFITTTDLNHFPQELLKHAQVFYVPDFYTKGK